MPPGDLEDVVDRALKELPAPRAPRTLLPRVMAAIESGRAEPAPARTPRARPWVTWPLAWQVASVAVVIALGLGVARLWPLAASVVALCRPNAGGRCAATDQRVCRRSREHGRDGRERDANRLARARAAVCRVSAGPDSRDVCRVRHVRRRAGPSRSRRSSADMKSIHLRLAAVAAAIVLGRRAREPRGRRIRCGPGCGPTSRSRTSSGCRRIRSSRWTRGRTSSAAGGATSCASARTTRSSRESRSTTPSSSSARRPSTATCAATSSSSLAPCGSARRRSSTDRSSWSAGTWPCNPAPP